MVGTRKIQTVSSNPALLGEGPFWDINNNSLYWIDILDKRLFIYNPDTRKEQSFLLPESPGTVVPALDRTLIIPMETGIYRYDITSGNTTLITDPRNPEKEGRFNDGKCDPAGRLWVGTMSRDEKKGEASLYRLDTDGTAKRIFTGVSISNGIIWSTSGDTLYYIDTPERCVRAYDFNKKDGTISNRRDIIFAENPEQNGLFDGMTIDTNGNLWIAHWGGSKVSCWNPESGRKIEEIEVPALHVTACVFGGPELSTLYITTSSAYADTAHKKRYPNAGNLFSIDLSTEGIRGIPSKPYSGDFNKVKHITNREQKHDIPKPIH